jgi:copper(I)-binding protein
MAQTSQQLPAVEGASGDAGDSIALRNVWIPYPRSGTSYPPGSRVPVAATIVNQGPTTDELVAVSSPVSGWVEVSGTVHIPPGTNVVSIADSWADAAGTASPLVVGRLRIVLVTTRVLRAGLDTPVTFRFRNAGTVTLSVPMAAPANG